MQHTPYAPTRVQTGEADAAAVYKRAVRAMGDLNVPIAEKDVDAGVVAGEWQDIDSIDETQYRIRITIDEGEASVLVDCRTPSVDMTTYGEMRDCPGESRPQGRIDLARRIAAALK